MANDRNLSKSGVIITYALSLVAAFLVYGEFALLIAGPDLLPVVSICASIVHFGVSSWLFLFLPKVGRVFSILTSLLLCAWPICAVGYSIPTGDFVFFFFSILPVLFVAVVGYYHIKTFNGKSALGIAHKIGLALLPFSLSVYVLFQLLSSIQFFLDK